MTTGDPAHIVRQIVLQSASTEARSGDARDPVPPRSAVGALQGQWATTAQSHGQHLSRTCLPRRGLPTERYIAFHAEKARGGIGMTMIGGSALVSADSAPVFGNLTAYKDEIVPSADQVGHEVHGHSAAVSHGPPPEVGPAQPMPATAAPRLRPARRHAPRRACGHRGGPDRRPHGGRHGTTPVDDLSSTSSPTPRTRARSTTQPCLVCSRNPCSPTRRAAISCSRSATP